MNNQEKIQKEVIKLTEIFDDIPDDKKSLCEGLIQNAAFMHVTLQELQNSIMELGATIKCQSGNGFETIKDNPAQKAYTTMIARYSNVINQLCDFLPTEKQEAQAKAGEALKAFITAGRPKGYETA